MTAAMRCLPPPDRLRHGPRQSTVQVVVAVTMIGLLWCTAGCSLFVMAGKALLGDPVRMCDFQRATHVDLAKQNKRVLVVCDVPEYVRTQFPALQSDLIEGMARRLKRHGIDVVDPDDVSRWIEDQGGRWERLSDLADQFDTDYIIHIEIEDYTDRVERSPQLLQARIHGAVHAYEVHSGESSPRVAGVFVRELDFSFPRTHPELAEHTSVSTFRRRMLDRLCDDLARIFYNYRVADAL